MKRQLSFLALALVLAQCSDNDDPKKTAAGCLLTENNGTEGNTTSDLLITYNNDKKATAVTFTSTNGDGVKITYNGTLDSNGHLTKVAATTSSLPEGFFTSETLSYDGAGNLTEAVVAYGPTSSIKVVYTYNSSKQVTQAATTLTDSGMKYYGYETYSYSNTSNKNPSKVESFTGTPGGGTLSTTTTFTYDDKKTPQSASTVLSIGELLTENNPLTETRVTVGGNTSTTTYSYVYNDQGYPVSRSYTELGISYSNTYTYSCN